MDIPDRQVYIGVAVISIGLIAGIIVLAGHDGGDELEASGNKSVQVADEVLYSGQSFEDLNDAVVSGGVPQDGIPSIDDPNFVSADEAVLDDGDVVFGIEHEGEIKAYPQRILVSHEIVNDEFGGETHAVTYCPLTATAMGQKSGAEVGVSGNLVNSNLIMYDRDTESYWPQIMSTAISGEKEGESMEEFRVVWTTWEEWSEKHPETEVLSEDTGFLRNYDNDPYGDYNPASGYYTDEEVFFPTLGDSDERHSKDMVLGYRNTEGAAAFDYDLLRDERVIDAEIGGDYVMVYEEQLDTGRLYSNPEQLEVNFEDDSYTVNGEDYRPDDLPLEERPVFDAFWFAWNSFYPEAELYE